MLKSSKLNGSTSNLEFHFADVMSSVMNPSKDCITSTGLLGSTGNFTANEGLGKATGTRYNIGGFVWNLLEGHRMEDYLLFETSAFANVVLTFNGCDIGRSALLFIGESVSFWNK